MKCPKCGEENKENGKFCLFCGAPLQDVKKSEESAKKKAQNEEEKKKPKEKKGKPKKEKKKHPVVRIFLILFVLLLFGAFIFCGYRYKTYSLPNVEGLKKEEALTKLKEKNVQITEKEEKTTKIEEAGKVFCFEDESSFLEIIFQKPKGTLYTYYYYEEDSETDLLTVPDLIGYDMEEAQKVLDAKKLSYLFLEVDSTEKEGTVLSLNPKAGEVITKDTIIQVTISRVLQTEKEEKNWSSWTEKLPSNVTKENYEIETKTEYRSKEKETTTSKNKTLAGWTYEKKITEYGAWGNSKTEKYTTEDNCKTLENSCKSSTTKNVLSKQRIRYYARGACVDPVTGAVEDTSKVLNYFSSEGTFDLDHDGGLNMMDQVKIIDKMNAFCSMNHWYLDRVPEAKFLNPETPPSSVLTVTYNGETYKDKYAIGSRLSSTYTIQQYLVTKNNYQKSYNAYIIMSGYYSCNCTYQTRTQSTMYQFYRYTNVSDWTEKEIKPTATKEVEKRVVYRYREKIK